MSLENFGGNSNIKISDEKKFYKIEHWSRHHVLNTVQGFRQQFLVLSFLCILCEIQLWFFAFVNNKVTTSVDHILTFCYGNAFSPDSFHLQMPYCRECSECSMQIIKSGFCDATVFTFKQSFVNLYYNIFSCSPSILR